MRDVFLSTIRQSFSLRRFSQISHRRNGVFAAASSAFRGDFPRRESHGQRRTAKTRAKVHLGEISQGSFEPGDSRLENGDDGGPSYPTVVQQAYDNMRKFENCVLLTRVGSFYEVRSTQEIILLLLITISFT